MFLDTSKINRNNILNEAEDDENNQPQDEPTEDSAGMDLEQEAGVDSEVGGTEGESGEEGMEGSEGEASDMGDGGMDAGGTAIISDPMKKRRLFTDFKSLLNLTESLLDSLSFINYEALTDAEKKIFNFIENKMKENHEKLTIILTEQYEKIEYAQLLKLFLYIKMSVKNFSEIIKTFIDE